MKTYRFIEDPGHGWLEVSLAEIKELGLMTVISSYSYYDKNTDLVYLEEDDDMSRFLKAKWPDIDRIDYPLKTIRVYQEDTFVRELPHFCGIWQ